MEQEAAAGGLPQGLIGHHKNAGSWLVVKDDSPGAPLHLRIARASSEMWAPLAIAAFVVRTAYMENQLIPLIWLDGKCAICTQTSLKVQQMLLQLLQLVCLIDACVNSPCPWHNLPKWSVQQLRHVFTRVRAWHLACLQYIHRHPAGRSAASLCVSCGKCGVWVTDILTCETYLESCYSGQSLRNFGLRVLWTYKVFLHLQTATKSMCYTGCGCTISHPGVQQAPRLAGTVTHTLIWGQSWQPAAGDAS